jgi:hypothetical protein
MIGAGDTTAATAPTPPPPPLAALQLCMADALLEFLEAAVHTVLHARGLYPPELFERRRLYGSCLCPRARHPGVCAYVASALAALRAPLLRGALQEVAVVVREEEEEGGGAGGPSARRGRALEKVSFVLHRAAAAAAAGGGAGGGGGNRSSGAAVVPLPDVAALEAAFAAALVKLQHLPQAPPLRAGAGGSAAAASAARPLPRGATFEIVGLATSREGVDRSVLMEEDVLEAVADALLLPSGSAGGQQQQAPAGWPLKTIRLNDDGGGGGAAASLTILVEAAAR